jgi:two-component system, OmpR family, KDP operon response regulator KdpE
MWLKRNARHDLATLSWHMGRDASGGAATPGPAPQATSVLIIDDEPQIRRVVRDALQGEVGAVFEAGTGAGGLALAVTERPDLIVLDLGLPDAAGEAICRQLREKSRAPIVVLSARHTDAEKVALLDAGADDYVTKPFSSDELRARVRAQLRRASGALRADHNDTLTLGAVSIDFATPSLKRDGAPVHLTRTEWDLLRALANHGGRTVTHAQLFREVWGNVAGDAQQYLRVYVRSLRRKLEADPVRPQLIVTEPGVGYRLERPAGS